MDDHSKLIISLIEKATEYGKTSFELGKLKILDKTVDVFSSFAPCSVVFALIALSMLFFNFGLAFWLGEIFGETYLGFIVVAAFYSFLGLFIYFFLHKWLKKLSINYIIKKLLK